MAAQHIRCSQNCECPSEDLFENKCGSCLYHKECAPEWCRCGSEISFRDELTHDRCIYSGCKNKREAGGHLLCKQHLETLDSFIVKKISILPKINVNSLVEMVTYFSNQTVKGDRALLIVKNDLMASPDRKWQLVMSHDRQWIESFSVVVNRLVSEQQCSVKDALAELQLPEMAYSLICEDARVQRNSWTFDEKRRPCPVSFKKTYDKETLLTKIKTFSKPAVPVEKIISMYDEATDDLLQLIAEGCICKLDNAQYVCVNTAEKHESALLAHWTAHVDGLD